MRRKARAAAFALVCVAPFLVLEISSASGEDQETPAADHDRSVDRSEPDENSASAKPAPRLGEPRRLTRDGIFKRDPVWARSPGGPPYLVYSVQHDSVRMTLVRLSDDGQEAPLHPKASLPEFRPTYSHDGSVYVFLQSRGNQNLTLAVRRPGEESEKHIHSQTRNPAILPDGSGVLVSVPADGGQQIALVDLEGKNERRLTSGPHFANWPAASPDGRHFAYASDRSGDLEIWIDTLDGGEPRQVTKSRGRDLRPAWSPDGKRIAFASGRDGNLDIFVMDADGERVTRVTTHPELDDYPSWHPDGDRLVFVGERDGRFDLYEIAVPPPEKQESLSAP